MVSFVTDNWIIDNIDTVLFDKDGTFVDLHSLWGKITELRVNSVIDFYKLNPNTFSQLCLCLGYDVNSKKMLKDGITALFSRSKIIKIFSLSLMDFGVCATIDEITQIFDEVSSVFNKNLGEYTVEVKFLPEVLAKVKVTVIAE